MSVAEPNAIDFASVDKATGVANLTISDHLPWDDDDIHLEILQDKLNAYISFYESGQIYEKYPESKSRDIRFSIVFKFAPPDDVVEYLTSAATGLREAHGIDLTWRQR